jgi:hypothetical protein
MACFNDVRQFLLEHTLGHKEERAITESRVEQKLDLCCED